MVPLIIKAIGNWILTHWRWVSCYVAGVLTVVLLLAWCDKPPIQPSTQTVTIWDTLPPTPAVHDTVTLRQVVRHYVRDTVVLSVHDTTVMVMSTVVDSESCISGSYVAPDSAQIDWSACSKEFNYRISDQILWSVKYVAAPRIIERQNRFDTIHVCPTQWQQTKTAGKWMVIGGVVYKVLEEGFKYFITKR